MRSSPAIIAAVLTAVFTAMSEGEPRAPDLLQEIGIDQHLGEKLPPSLVFFDAAGEARSLGERWSGRPVVLVPVYYECPMLCGETLRGLVSALKAVPFEAGIDFDVLVVSFDPKETPELAARTRAELLQLYGDRGSPSGWQFLTANAGTIASLMESIGFRYAYDSERDLFAHASALLVLTPEGRISRYFFGIDYAPRDLRLGVVEASNNDVGGLVEAVLLYCYHYDPGSGRYGVVILNVLRLAGAITVLLLGSFMLLGFLRDARGRSTAARGS